MSNETVASWVWCGSRLTTIRTVFDPDASPAAVEAGAAAVFEYAITESLSVWWKCTERS